MYMTEDSPSTSLNLDVLRCICDVLAQRTREDSAINIFDGLSRTNHLMRTLCLPFLFRTVTIRGNCENALTKVEEMQRSSVIDKYIRTFKFDLNLYRADAEEDTRPVERASAFAKVLARMHGLEKLTLVIPHHHIDDIADAIAREHFTLPNVHTLVVGPFCDFAVQLCPNVTTISSNGWQWLQTRSWKTRKSSEGAHTLALINAAAHAPKITSLEIIESWTVDLVEAVRAALLSIPRLSLAGSRYQGGIAKFIPTLSHFERLEYLALAGAYALGVGFLPPKCGNAYTGRDGKEVQERVNREGEQAEVKVAKMVAPACPVLKELWIGDWTRVEVLRNDDGSFKDVSFHRGVKREKVVHHSRL